MNDLLKTSLFGLLSETSQEVINEEVQIAYEDFVIQVSALNQSGTDYSKVFRILNLTRIEFDSLGSSPLYEQGEKCPQISLSSKGVSICHFGIRATQL